MPILDQDEFGRLNASAVRVALEPAHSAIESLFLLARSDDLPGLPDWVAQTLSKMTEAERQTNALVMFGMHYLVAPQQSWGSFPAYIDHLARIQPETLRDRMLEMYDVPVREEYRHEALDRQSALQSAENYVRYLQQRFEPEHMDEEIEARVYPYLMDPPAMQSMVVEHLWNMWRKYLKEEWERNRPLLLTVVQAHNNVDFQQMTRNEAALYITGQEQLPEKLCAIIEKNERVVFVPHMHVGPYLRKGFMRDPVGEKAMVVFYGARMPKGLADEVPALSRAEIVIRLGALADDNRLRLLKIIADTGEMRSSEIITALDLSQSAASRHLTQLTATGYLKERRCDGAKCYALNPERIADTLRAVEHFLQIQERSLI